MTELTMAAPPPTVDIVTFWAAVVASFFIGGLFTAGAVWYFAKNRPPKVTITRTPVSMLLVVLLVGLYALGQGSVALAQTPVPLEIPVNDIFVQTNNWMTTLAPIAAIGIGIPIAMGILGYIGKMLISAFRGG